MDEFWILILVTFFATNFLDKAKSVQMEEIDEIFGEGWWDNDKADEWHKLTLEQNFLYQIDRQNTQIGQIEPNSTDQNPPLTESDQFGQIEHNSTDQNPPLTESDQFGQIESNSTDQNPPLTESDHSDNAKNDEEQNEIMEEMTSNKKRKIIDKFHAIKDELKQKGKFPWKERNQIENEIAKQLGVNSSKKIYKWKKEFGLSQKVLYEIKERKHLVDKFDQMKAELKLAGFKNSYPNQINKTVAKKELGLSFITIYRWKSEFGQSKPKKYPHSEQKKLMKRYYEIKDENPKISNEKIAKMLKIGKDTLYKWKKQFKRQQSKQNSVDGHSVE